MLSSVFENPGFYITYAVIQAIVLLLLIQVLDRFKRRPIVLITVLALWGATGAAGIALSLNGAVRRWVPGNAGIVFGDAIAPPIVEECAKGLALLASFFVLRRVARRMQVSLFDGPMDGVVYGAAVGLGFGFTEDFFYFIQRARDQGVDQALHVFLDRRDFFGPAMLHHPLFTAAFGAGLGLASWARGRARQVGWAALGLFVAIAIHAVNNGLVEATLTLRYGLDAAAAWEQNLPVAPDVASTGNAMLVVLRLLDYVYAAVFVAGVLLWQRYQRRILDSELEEEVHSGLISADEKERVLHRWRGTLASWKALRRGLPEQWLAHRRFENEVVDLGLLKWRLRKSGGDERRINLSRRRIISLKTLGATPSELPAETARLIGREHELAESTALLRDRNVHLVTLIGPGGTGKTRLALALANELAEEFASGAVFVSLASINDPELVPSTIAHALDLRETPGQSFDAVLLREYLRDKQLLLVLDNFEHVMAAGPLVSLLVAAAPHLKILVTSRTPLRASGEREYDVPPLPLPEPGSSLPPEALVEYPAIELFMERARAVAPDFQLTEENSATVAEICRRLDGLPLAIELAAARTRLLDPTTLLNHLNERLDVLVGGPADRPTRQRTLRGAIEWSHGLLSPAERSLFARLSVFRGAWSLDAAEGVCRREEESRAEFMALLESLVENSLVERRQPEDGEARFGMLQSIREYAFERLRELGEFEESHRALARYYLRLVEEAETDFLGPAEHAWLRRITADYNNIRGALSASLGLGDSDQVLRLGSSLVRFWEARGMLSEGRSWLEDALAASNTDPSARATALTSAGRLAFLQGDYEQAERLLREGLELAEEVGDQSTRGRALAWLARTATARHDYASAVQLALTADHIARKIDDRDLLASALAALGSAAAREGDHQHARMLLEQSYNLRRELGNPSSIATSLLDLGWIALLEGDFARADELLDDGLRRCRELDDVSKTAICLTDLGLSALRQGALDRSEKQLQESLTLCARLMDRQTAARCLCGLAGLAGSRGDADRAARLAGAAEALRGRVGVALWPVETAIYDELVHPLRDVIGDTEFSRAWADGRLLESDVLRALGDETRLRQRTMSGIQWVIGARPPEPTRTS